MEQNRRESYAGPLEVAAMFGDDFLAKRFAAGKEEGLEEGVVKGRGERYAALARPNPLPPL